MDSDFKKVRQLTAFMRKQGILKLKSGQIEIEVSPGALIDTPTSSAPHEAQRDSEPLPSPDEAALGLPAGALDRIMWSSPGYVGPDEAGS